VVGLLVTHVPVHTPRKGVRQKRKKRGQKRKGVEKGSGREMYHLLLAFPLSSGNLPSCPDKLEFSMRMPFTM